MEEREQKRFRTDEDAMRFVQEVTQGRALPPQIWLKILANDPELHVDDIQAIARADPRGIVRELTKSGAVWEAIIRRQFGQEELDKWKQERPNAKALHILIGLRLSKVLQDNFAEKNRNYVSTRQKGYYASDDIRLEKNGRRITVYAGSKVLFVKSSKEPSQELDKIFRQISPNYLFRGDIVVLQDASVKEALIGLVSQGFRPLSRNLKDKAYMGACAFCGKEAADLPICSGCDSVAYCGEECQEEHWKERHHKEC